MLQLVRKSSVFQIVAKRCAPPLEILGRTPATIPLTGRKTGGRFYE